MNNDNSSYRDTQILKLVDKMKETEFIKKGKFTLKSGIQSSYYVDVKSLISYPEIMANLANLLYIKIIEIVKSENISIDDIVLCGLPYAGIPFVSYISLKYHISMILLRKEKKNYGTKKLFEGTIDKKKHLIFVDDILTTGTSIKESLEYFKDFQIAKSAVVLIDREENETPISFENISNLYSVFKLSQFV